MSRVGIRLGPVPTAHGDKSDVSSDGGRSGSAPICLGPTSVQPVGKEHSGSGRGCSGAASSPAETAKTGPSMGTWEWKCGDGWESYDAEGCALITDAYVHHRPTCTLLHGVYGSRGGYVIDLDAMVQTPLRGGRQRLIRGCINSAEALPLSKRVSQLADTVACDAASGAGVGEVAGSTLPDIGDDEDEQDSPGGAPVAHFEWRDYRGWKPFDAASNAAISAAMGAKSSVVQLTIGGRRYEVDLARMQQRNMATGVTRDVRAAETHIAKPAADDLAEAIWEWREEEDAGFGETWCPYPASVQADLERARRAGKSKVSINGTNGGSYTVLLDQMVQISVRRQQRPVRRTEASMPPTNSRPRPPLQSKSTADVRWEQQDLEGGGAWSVVDASIARELESVFHGSAEGADIQLDGSVLLVDLVTLQVEDAATGKRWRLRRRPAGRLGFEGIADAAQVFQAWEAACTAGVAYEDLEFEGESALYKGVAKPGLVAQWCRPADIRGLGPRCHMLRNDVSARDVAQGGIGDCWLVSVLALMATRPDLLRPLLLTPDVNPAGAYVVRLCYAGQWRSILVDDLLPCRQSGTLAYTVAHREQLWAPLIEKAYAKMHGSYEALVGGQMYEAMGALTGCICDIVRLYKKAEEDAWRSVCDMLEHGFLLCTSVRTDANAEQAKDLGLVTAHAYSVLDAHEHAGFRVVQLRNPHGRGVWKGDWSDLSPTWDSLDAPKLPHDGVRQKPPTGRFWMSFGDFLRWFGTLQYCKVRPDGWHDRRLDVSISPPDLVGNHGRAFAFTVATRTKLEAAMLQVGRRGRACSAGMADVGFAILRATAGVVAGSGGQEVRQGSNGCNGKVVGKSEATMTVGGKRYELLIDCPRRQHGCVALEAEIEAGEYLAVPVVLGGRRAAKPGSGQDRATFVLQSCPAVRDSAVLEGFNAGALQRDVIILRVLNTGTRHSGTADGGDILLLNDPCGHTIVARNLSPVPIRVNIDAKRSLRCESSRGATRTSDVVLPGHAQVLAVFTFGVHYSGPKSLSWTSQIHCLPRHGTGDERSQHQPPLPDGSAAAALHEAVSLHDFDKSSRRC